MQPSDVIKIRQAADRLVGAAISGQPIDPPRDLLDTDDIDLAYAIQAEQTRRRISGGVSVIGRKIGLTSAAVQQQLGVDQPDFGVLFDDMDVTAEPQVPSDRLLQPKAEAEVAFVLKSDLTDEGCDHESVSAAVDYAVAALEIVDSRIRDWDITIADTIADNASSGMFVLADRRLTLDEFNPTEVIMEMHVNEELASQGSGHACLGGPINALVWLARTAVQYGNPLRAGQIVLSGALGPMVPAPPGTDVRADLGPLGVVSATFSQRQVCV